MSDDIDERISRLREHYDLIPWWRVLKRWAARRRLVAHMRARDELDAAIRALRGY